jgi:hypothetical protein
MTRLIDYLCDRHQQHILDTHTWPDDWRFGAYCTNCGSASQVLQLPHLDPNQQLAIHEAGHAVAHLTVGTRLLYASLNADDFNGEVAGGVRFEDGPYDAVALMAGAAAVSHWARMFGPLSDADWVDVVFGASHDFRDAYNEGLTVAEAAGVGLRANILVSGRWDAIERVADMLLVRGRLSGAEIADLAGMAGCTR